MISKYAKIFLVFLKFQTSVRIFNSLMDILTRYQLTLDLCRGQCYDGTSKMLGKIRELSNKFLISKQKHISRIVVEIPRFLVCFSEGRYQALDLFKNTIEFSTKIVNFVNLLSANPTKWSNTLKQFVGKSRRFV